MVWDSELSSQSQLCRPLPVTERGVRHGDNSSYLTKLLRLLRERLFGGENYRCENTHSKVNITQWHDLTIPTSAHYALIIYLSTLSSSDSAVHQPLWKCGFSGSFGNDSSVNPCTEYKQMRPCSLPHSFSSPHLDVLGTLQPVSMPAEWVGRRCYLCI